jgi:plasmid stabilization system protein ParE
MKPFTVIISPRAENDIEHNARWWAEHHNAAEAAVWFYSVRRQILSLQNVPESHGLSNENDDFPYEIRDLLIGLGSRPSYQAVFTIHTES